MRLRTTWHEAQLVKAELAVAVAKRILPHAEDETIEDQAVALLHMPDDELAATHARLMAADESRELALEAAHTAGYREARAMFRQEPKTAADRYFDQQMQDPEFAADYNEERAIIDVVDAAERLRRVRLGVDP